MYEVYAIDFRTLITLLQAGARARVWLDVGGNMVGALDGLALLLMALQSQQGRSSSNRAKVAWGTSHHSTHMSRSHGVV